MNRVAMVTVLALLLALLTARPPAVSQLLETVTGGNGSVECGNGADDDGDGVIDAADPGCTDASDTTEAPNAEAPNAQPPTCAPLKAFCGAEGFGADSVGGRGGAVLHVTNLNDSGAGSLREALTAPGPRIVVFDTGGTINLLSEIQIHNPYLTVAGQTAPGGGVTIKADASYDKSALAIETHDVVIRGLRIRPDATAAIAENRRGLEINTGPGNNVAYNVIVDHTSISWGQDDNLVLGDGAHDVTISWSFITEGLSQASHPEGEHSRGLNVSVKQYDAAGPLTQNLSIHHNLLAHNVGRNPEVDAAGTVDLVNNVVYHWGKGAVRAGDKLGTSTPVNAVGNYFKRGPTHSGGYEIKGGDTGVPTDPLFYVQGNIGPHRPDDTLPETNIVDPSWRRVVVGSPFPAPPVTTTSAAQAFTDVVGCGGAIEPSRDSVDSRIASQVQTGTGVFVNNPADVGGWPMLAAGTSPVDTDNDGMPDSYEDTYGFDPVIDDSAGDANADGYTNVEEYINGLIAC
jgi:pectate lyase